MIRKNKVLGVLLISCVVFYSSIFTLNHKIQTDKANTKWVHDEEVQSFRDFIIDQDAQIKELNRKVETVNTENEKLKSQLKKISPPSLPSAKSSTSTLSRGGSLLSMEHMGSFRVTAYSLAYEDCEKYEDDPEYGIGANMKPIKEWHTIAMDKSIPFGTKVYIPYFKDMPNGGIFYKEDHGGAIKGNRIDVYMKSSKKCREFGVRQLDVYIIR